MKIESLINRLDNFKKTLPVLATPLSDREARWKPEDGAWSILEICRHLLDEEVEDFRARVQSTFKDPTADWIPWTPEENAVSRKYNEANRQDTIEQFVIERDRSVEWLRSNMVEISKRVEQAHQHPIFGPLQLGELLVAWVAHDQLHLRQISKRLFQLTELEGAPYSTRYAGNW